MDRRLLQPGELEGPVAGGALALVARRREGVAIGEARGDRLPAPRTETRTNRQGRLLPTEGARWAAARQARSTVSSIGSRRKRRTSRRHARSRSSRWAKAASKTGGSIRDKAISGPCPILQNQKKGRPRGTASSRLGLETSECRFKRKGRRPKLGHGVGRRPGKTRRGSKPVVVSQQGPEKAQIRRKHEDCRLIVSPASRPRHRRAGPCPLRPVAAGTIIPAKGFGRHAGSPPPSGDPAWRWRPSEERQER